jgi:8-oxo-dGTP pyrophosphatase MutT (NUDIX family)
MKIGGAHIVFHRLLRTSKTKPHQVRTVLLTKRTLDAPTHPGYWGLVGGTVDPGESAKDAAVREAGEELGITPASMKFLCDVRVDHGGRKASGVKYFSAPLDLDMDKLTLKRNSEDDRVEAEGIAWFSAEEIHHIIVRPEDRIAIATFFERHGT